MNNAIRNTLIVVAVLVLAGVLFIAGMFFAGVLGFWPGGMLGWRVNNGYGPGMMGGYGSNGYGPGMMGGYGSNGYGPGMMGGYGNNGYGPGMTLAPGASAGVGGYDRNSNAAPLSIDQAKTAAEAYLKGLGLEGLHAKEVMIFDNNAYVVVEETATRNGAFELLVDPVSKTAYPEIGPNMMWNLKYGGLNHSQMMGGRGGMMMGGSGWDTTIPSDVSIKMDVSPEKAIQYAQAYLDSNFKGATAASDPVQFYGYYTLDFEKDGKVTGMLSVNGFSGQVFLHTWHGTFIEESGLP